MESKWNIYKKKKLRIIYIYTIRYGFSKSQNDKKSLDNIRNNNNNNNSIFKMHYLYVKRIEHLIKKLF